MKLVPEKKLVTVTFDSWRDWKRLFFLFIILTCIGLLWSAYVYWWVESGTAFYSDAAPVSSTTVLPANDMKMVEDRYDAKAKAFEVYSASASSTVVDPSL